MVAVRVHEYPGKVGVQPTWSSAPECRTWCFCSLALCSRRGPARSRRRRGRLCTVHAISPTHTDAGAPAARETAAAPHRGRTQHAHCSGSRRGGPRQRRGQTDTCGEGPDGVRLSGRADGGGRCADLGRCLPGDRSVGGQHRGVRGPGAAGRDGLSMENSKANMTHGSQHQHF